MGSLSKGLIVFLLHIGYQLDHYLTAALNHPNAWWSFLLQVPRLDFLLSWRRPDIRESWEGTDDF